MAGNKKERSLADKSALEKQLKNLIFQAVRQLKIKVNLAAILLDHPARFDHGDYFTSFPLQVESEIPPYDLACKIVNNLRSIGLPDYLAKIEVAKPGFINFWLTKDFLISQLKEVLNRKEKFGYSPEGKGKTVVVDYSSPNIARPFGVGHFRSTIIGQAIVNLYRFLGWKVVGINYLGDWGTQFGKLIYQIKKRRHPEKLTLKDLERLYVDFHQKAEKTPQMADEARKWFKKLEEGDQEAIKIWKNCVAISLKEFEKIYRRLGVKFDEVIGESFFQDKIKTIIDLAKKKKILVKSQGAWVVEFPDLKIPPALLLKSDGATTYVARDLASLNYRRQKWQPDLFVYEVGAEQTLHFRQVFTIAVKLGFGKADQFVHVGHGIIYLPGVGKLSTRKGKTIYLEKLLDEAVKRAKKLGSPNQKIAEMVGVGAVKYFDLKNHPSTNIAFDWQKMFALEGDSGPYLQYTYARTQSVLEKFKSTTSDSKILDLDFSFETYDLNFEINNEEMDLLRTLYKFPEIVREAGKRFAPNLICGFLFDLAQKYNVFYNRWPILKADNLKVVNFRLVLTLAVGQVIKNGLQLLGIEAPAKM